MYLDYRKDKSPKETIKTIKAILGNNNIKVKECKFKKFNNYLYYGRLKYNYFYGTNGKGISKTLAKASAYAEFIERLQTNMLGNNKRLHKNLIVDRKNKYIKVLLKNATQEYYSEYIKLDDSYFYVDDFVDLKTNNIIKLPINSINAICHTNGLASGNTKTEATVQGICEILERYAYKQLLNGEILSYSIEGYDKILSNTLQKILSKISKLGFKYEIKDCSLSKYPVVGFILYNGEKNKYCYTLASDVNFNIAISRAITEMFQGQTKKSILLKMKDVKMSLDFYDKKYGKNFKSYNWLNCFNYNNGIITSNMLCNKKININKLFFKNDIKNNEEALQYLMQLIENSIFIKDYNVLGFDTVRVYIPTMSEIDSFDKEDLIISRNYSKYKSIYCDILSATNKELNDFIDMLLEICKCIKFYNLVFPKDLFKVNSYSKYYKLSFTSLLILLCLITNRKDDLKSVLQFQISNFILSKEIVVSYSILLDLISGKCSLKQHNMNIARYFNEIIKNPKKYLLSLNPKTNITADILFEKLN